MTSSPIQTYAELFDRLHPDNLTELRACLHDHVRFKDPFNDVHNADAMVGLMAQMFEDTTNPTFETSLVLADGLTGLIKWHFHCEVRYFGKLAFDGVSEVKFDEQGLLVEHIDYWDAGEAVYGKLPILGRAINFVRRRLAYRG